MKFSVYDWLFFLGIPLVALFAARSWRRSKTARGYFFASGQLSSMSVANTYLGSNLTFTSIFLILSEEAYLRGAWVFSIPICWIIGTFFFIRLYPYLRPYIERDQTLHEAMGECYDSAQTRRAASVWTILAFTGTVGLEFYGAFVLLKWAGLSNSANLAVAGSLAFITSYLTVTGGLRSVAFADYVFNIATIIGLGLLLYYGWNSIDGAQANTSAQQLRTSSNHAPSLGDNILFVISMVILFVPFQLCTLDSWQRLVAWKNKEESPAKWLTSSGFGLALVYCIPIVIGMSLRRHSISYTLHPLQAFLEKLHTPAGVNGLIFAGFAAAILSTADELMNCCGLSLIFDTLQVSRQEMSRNSNAVVSGQFYTVVFACVSSLIAMLAIKFERRISDLALAVFSTQVVFTVPLLLMFKNKDKARRIRRFVIYGMGSGFTTALLLVIGGWLSQSQDMVDAAPVGAFFVSSIIVIIGLLVKKTREVEGNAT